MFTRRSLFAGASAAALLSVTRASRADEPISKDSQGHPRTQELSADVVILGGGVGGCAAALAAAEAGVTVIMTESTDWIGGQFTAQCLPAPDEHGYIESFGRTATYARYRNLVREYYRQNYPLTDTARANPSLNPGAGWVSGLCHEPAVALSVLHQMLAPFVSSERIRILLQHECSAADVVSDRVQSVQVRDTRSGDLKTLHGTYFLDATETGDLLPLTGTEFVLGAQSRAETGELHASEKADPADVQSITYCFAVDYLPDGDFTIDKPEQYEQWRHYVPALQPAWPGKLFSMDCSSPYRDEVRRFCFEPDVDRAVGQRFVADSAQGKIEDLWTYRRLISRHNFTTGTYPGSVSLVNWPQNDYWLGNVVGVSADEAQRNLHSARQLSLSLLYWLQTEAPRKDGGQGWRGLRLRKDISGSDDGLAKTPYIRESRRIRAAFTVTEAHIGREQRMQITGKKSREVAAASFADSVGLASYRMDAHPTTGGHNYVDIDALPHQIPLGSLVPVRMTNLLPAAKNLGTTHVSSTAYREHPIEWNTGEAAGALAAFCLQNKTTPRAVWETDDRLQDFQRQLVKRGVELQWPTHALNA